jgi:hypothetical protein
MAQEEEGQNRKERNRKVETRNKERHEGRIKDGKKN